MKKMVQKCLTGVCLIAALALTGCASSQPSSETTMETSVAASETASKASSGESQASSESAGTVANADSEKVKLSVFIAASLKKSMEEVVSEYQKNHPDVEIVLNADSSGKLMTQIQEGFACDVFFSAAQKQMDTLESEGFVVDGTRKNVVNNQLTVISLVDSDTKVTGLETLNLAKSIALADGSVPVGRYTRIALNKLGILPDAEDLSKVTTAEVSAALGGVEISEQSNVSKVLAAVAEGSFEVGTVYFSDTYGFEDKVTIIEKVSYDLTGNVIYPIACIKNEEAIEAQSKAAKEFAEFVTSSDTRKIFEKYYFDTNVEQ